MLRAVLLLAGAALTTALEVEDLIGEQHHRLKRDVRCDILKRSCRDQIDNHNNDGRFVDPNFQSSKCEYEKQVFWLIPGEADNATCARPETLAKGVRVRILNDTVKIVPSPIRLPGCFNLSFQVDLLDTIEDVPRQFYGKNEFQLWELRDVEKLQCQNASNNGCGGYGNNCVYCDMCDSLRELDGREIRDKAKNRATQEFLSQFDDVRCPDRPGRYLVTRRLCFNDWSVMDADQNCKLDMLESLIENDAEADVETLRAAYEALIANGYSTLVSRFYLAHGETPNQIVRRQTKLDAIAKEWRERLSLRRRNWTVSDEEFERFVDWYVNFQSDVWHRDRYLPWLLYENEMACLKVSFTVCDKKPKSVTVAETERRGGGPSSWWQRRVRPSDRCPS